MMSWLYASAICAAVFAYWVVCRKNALKHQYKAADLMEKYFADENISDREKTKMYINYKLFRHWFALPFLFLAAPFFIVYAFVSKKYQPEQMASENSAEFDEVFKCLMQMYIVKNPIISTVFMSIFGVFFAIAVVIGTMLNKASKVPPPAMMASTIISKLSAFKHKHAH
ncbi:hypothetical protein MYA08_001860 [Cronobacter sakazakii]|uniref:hypothetical protein n=1 Tax=Cronobacter sakazakii TaxID=28141 RepID=UPI002895695E|nr:hypothetical protein [Cronobacter sakazakii]EJC1153977.1 hypothetical protein [Cronobacter sakazakii]EJC1182285.1 hypothetical protein [Cronobacter sakazakii]EJC1244285.1 hypothetical protein [Cronobacter sakazakii]EJC2073243.1 hypothetical protein [Cronobacter sakazakii]EKK7726653.1 hypothetical protein [Cronobacter sakazakii]